MPIWNNRELIGYASSIEGARRVIVAGRSYQNDAFTLTVWERPKYLQKILGLPAGYVFDYRYTGGKS